MHRVEASCLYHSQCGFPAFFDAIDQPLWEALEYLQLLDELHAIIANRVDDRFRPGAGGPRLVCRFGRYAAKLPVIRRPDSALKCCHSARRAGMHAEVKYRQINSIRQVVGIDVIPEICELDRRHFRGSERLPLRHRCLPAEKAGERSLRLPEIGRTSRILRIVDETALELEQKLEALVEICSRHGRLLR